MFSFILLWQYTSGRNIQTHTVKKKGKLFSKKNWWMKLIAHWDWPVCSIPWHWTCSPGNMPITSPCPDHLLRGILRDTSTLPTRAPQTSLWPVTAPRGNAGTPFKAGWLKLQHRTQHLKIFKTKATCRCWFAVWSRVAPRPSGAVLQQGRGRPEAQGMGWDGPATSSEGQAIPAPWPYPPASQKAPCSQKS